MLSVLVGLLIIWSPPVFASCILRHDSGALKQIWVETFKAAAVLGIFEVTDVKDISGHGEDEVILKPIKIFKGKKIDLYKVFSERSEILKVGTKHLIALQGLDGRLSTGGCGNQRILGEHEWSAVMDFLKKEGLITD